MTIAAYPKHESFKPSGFDWIGNVPEHWDVEKLGSMLTAVSEKNRPDLPLLSITREQGVIERDVDDQDSNHNFIPDDLSGYKVLREGQFGMNKMKAWQGSYGVSAHTGIVSPAYFIFDFAREVDPHFFNIAIRSKLYVSYFGSASDGVRVGQWDLNQSRMRQIPILLPPLPEQRTIAAFLDGKCATIDEAVRIKEEQIRLLAERRQILIQEAVTRGLNPDAPMKDSGIDWIGEVPSTWSIEPGRQCLYESKEKNIGMKESTVLSLSYGRVIVRDEDKLTGLVPESFETYQVVQPGDIIIRGTDLQNDMTSLRTGLARDTGIITSAYINLRPKADIDPKFLHYLLHSYDVKKVFYALGSGLRQNLSYEDFKYLRLPIPPPQEQRAIAEFLDGKCATIDKAISLKESQIAALREYKASLINAAVTGKIKVL